MLRLVYETEDGIRERLSQYSRYHLECLCDNYTIRQEYKQKPFKYLGYLKAKYLMWKDGMLKSSDRALLYPTRQEFDIAQELLAPLRRNRGLRRVR